MFSRVIAVFSSAILCCAALATPTRADSCDDLRAAGDAGANSRYCTAGARTPRDSIEHATRSCAAGIMTAEWCWALDIARSECAGDYACTVKKIGNNKVEVTRGVIVRRGGD